MLAFFRDWAEILYVCAWCALLISGIFVCGLLWTVREPVAGSVFESEPDEPE